MSASSPYPEASRAGASQPEALEALIARSRSADGSPPFSDGALHDPSRELVWLGPAAALVSETEAEFVVDPDARGKGHGTAMLLHLLGADERLFWAHGDHPAARALASSHGLEPVRTLLHLEAPIAEALTSGSSHPGLSSTSAGWEAAFLALNARAFAHHPEQGRLTRADLDTTMAEPWFEPDDVLLLWDGDDLIGYCWLKVDEFYVVGVSPDRQGEGLGRVLMDAGFARLASKGIRVAHLYVEGDNVPALALYERYGFTPRSVDIQYRWPGGSARQLPS